MLTNGDLRKFEAELEKEIKNVYKNLAKEIITQVAESKEMEEKAKVIAQKKGLGQIKKTTSGLQLKTGDWIEIPSWFALRSKSKKRSQKKRGPNGSGVHILLAYWGCILKATPGYYALTTLFCILCPSFEIAEEVLNYQGTQAEDKRLRQLAYAMSEKCFGNRVKIALKPGESLAGKRVVISIDGGRTRTRKYDKNKKPCKKNKDKRRKFKTPWREPKLFVIHTLEADGSTRKMDLPIYDATLGNADASFALLEAYLRELQIHKASQVVFIADGARWIWHRVEKIFATLGVAEKTTQVVDYFHAVEHLNEIVSIFHRKELSKQQKKELLHKLKQLLWEGNTDAIIETVSDLAKSRKRIIRKLDYFKRNSLRMQYDSFDKASLPCGSGIVESAIRRVINLRFKSPSSFWNAQNVEKLIFLRSVFLAGRWKIMAQNLIYKIRSDFFVSEHKNSVAA